MHIVISNSGVVSKPFIERIRLIHGDITCQDSESIAMVIPKDFNFSGSLNESVAKAVGYNIDEFILENIYKPKVGDVYALPGGDLKAKHILVGIMPYYRTEFDRRESDLARVVRKIMDVARCMLLTSVAFPPLASGKNGYPKAKAARLICKGIVERIQENIEEVSIVCPDVKTLEIFDDKLRIQGWNG